jgi:uncharacterized phosphosugar-binding protein
MNASQEYAEAIKKVLDQVLITQLDAILKAASILTDVVASNGIIYTFGTGHSHIIAEDVTYRAGGLVPIDAILEPSLTGHQQVHKSETMERVEGVADVILQYYGISFRDCLMIISNSGRNAAPIEMAKGAQERGCPVIAVTSLDHSRGTTSRHSSGKKLFDFADVVIDNTCPRGDALLNLPGAPQSTGAGSGVSGLFIMQMIMVQTVENLIQRGIEPPLFRSGNLDGSDEINRTLMKRYQGRIKIW